MGPSNDLVISGKIIISKCWIFLNLFCRTSNPWIRSMFVEFCQHASELWRNDGTSNDVQRNPLVAIMCAARASNLALHEQIMNWADKTISYYLMWVPLCSKYRLYRYCTSCILHIALFLTLSRAISVSPVWLVSYYQVLLAKKTGHITTSRTSHVFCYVGLSWGHRQLILSQYNPVVSPHYVCIFLPFTTFYNHMSHVRQLDDIYIYIFTYDNAHFFGGDGHPSIFNQIQKNEGFPC